MTERDTRRGLGAVGVAVVALALSGCFGATQPGPVSLGQPAALTEAAPTGDHARVASAAPSEIPSPNQIFDFHPPGSRSDSWRQPFIIDPNDGPLRGYVRRMDAELKASDKEIAASSEQRRKLACANRKSGDPVRGCGENEAAGAVK